MERLTKRGTDGRAMMDCQKCEADWTGKHGKPMVDCTALYCRNRLKDRLADCECIKKRLEKAAKRVSAIPTADVVPVVRCKDCVRRGTPECGMYYECECGQQHTWETDNDFCSFGKRKEKNK